LPIRIITLIKKIKIENHFIGYHRKFREGNGEAKTITIDCVYHGAGYRARDIRVGSDDAKNASASGYYLLGGHIKSVKIWNETTKECAVAKWNGYHVADYRNLTFNTTLTLEKDVIYNYIIETGSYPQIIHAPYKQLNEGNITCTRFEDANGKEYNNWIPAFRLWYAPAAA